MAQFNMGSTSYSVDVPSTYVHEGAGDGKPLLLMIHGFQDSGPSFLRRTLPDLDPRFEILAPNGPFPLPLRVENEWKEAYGWYFADLSKKKIHVHPRVAAGAVANLVRSLGLESRPKILVGFSQGGYFLPHLARELREVQRFIVIGAGFHPEFFSEFGLTQKVHAIHGSADDVIPLTEARSDFERLAASNQGGFQEIPGMTHSFNEEGRAAFATLLGM
ncbi:MAG: alpha/beta hydrolase [Bdellovibrionota bacterium]